MEGARAQGAMGEVQKQRWGRVPVSLAQAIGVKRPLNFKREAREISFLSRVGVKS